MAKGSKVAATLIALTVAATLFGPVSTAVTQNSGTVSVTNETVTADVGNFTELDGYDIDENSETVYWYNSSSSSYETVSSGTDYEMGYENGSIKATSGGTIGDGDKLKVSYDYQATDPTSTTVITLIPLFMALLILVVLASKVMGMM